MLTLQQIKENPDDIVRRLGIKGFDGRKAIDDVLALDAALSSSVTTPKPPNSTTLPHRSAPR